MKKTVFILALILTILSSLIAGSLAAYTVKLDLATGTVVAKEFIFVKEGTETFQNGVKIAPTEKVIWQFGVKNYQGNVITETNLYYKLTLNAFAPDGKGAIDPLLITIKDADENLLGTIEGTGTYDILGEFILSEQGQEKYYVLEIYWPSGNNDINYAGEEFETAIRVDAVASQAPFSGQEPGGDDQNPGGGDDEEPGEPIQSDIHVKYKTKLGAWESGKFIYEVTITNNSDQAINNWNITFSLPNDRITEEPWADALADHEGLPNGTYRFIHKAYNTNILPGESVSFGGNANGIGNEAIQDVLVAGIPVELEYELIPGSEVPGGEDQDPDPEEPEQSNISVSYSTSAGPWQSNTFNYEITITNNSNQAINNWNIVFSLPNDRITANPWGDALADHEGLPDGTYRFIHKAYNKNILPGESVSFGGNAIGLGEENIYDVSVNGNLVTLE